MSTLSEQVIGVYDIGDEVELRAEFVDAVGAPANPSGGVVITVTKPDETTVTPAVTNPAVGTFVATVVPAVGESGDWWWRAASSGNIQQAQERSFTVRPPSGLRANALVSMRAARAWCLRDETDGSRDDLLALAINGVSSQIIRYCSREFFPSDDVTRVFSYSGSGYLSFDPYEIRAMSLLRARYIGYPNWTTLNDLGSVDTSLRPMPPTPEGTYLYMVAPEYVSPYGWPATLARGLGLEVEVTGDWGMSEIPADVEMATLLAVDWRYKNPSGTQSVNVGDLSQDSYYTAPSGASGVPALPGEVISMLEQFRRSQYGV